LRAYQRNWETSPTNRQKEDKRMRQYLRDMRQERNNMTTVNAAKLAGLKQTTYSMIEMGNRQADMALSVIQKLAIAFDVPLQTIIDKESAYIKSLSEVSA